MLEPVGLDAAVERELSRLVCIYGLHTPDRLPEDKRSGGADALWRLGRFEPHFTAGDAALPSFTEARLWATATLASSRGEFLRVEHAAARVAEVPHAGAALLFSLEFTGGTGQTIVALQETCFRKEELTVDGTPLVASLAEQLGADLSGLVLDREVHQCLFSGTALRRALLLDDSGTDFDRLALLRLVYREDGDFRPSGGSMRFPDELNRPARGVAAHGRGVSVVVGAAEHVERGVVLTALELVASLGCVRRVRREANAMLEDASSDFARPAHERTLGSRLENLSAWAARTRKLEIDLSFGVDRYLDNLRIPEIVLTSYRQSLAESLELPRALESSSRMIERLRRLIEVRHIELATIQAEEAERRRRANALAVGYITIIAVPIGFILGFLGSDVTEVEGSHSIRDLGFYWQPYLFAFLLMLPALAPYLYLRLRRPAVTPAADPAGR